MKCEFIAAESFEIWSQINEKELDIYFAETGMDRELDFDREVAEERLFNQLKNLNRI